MLVCKFSFIQNEGKIYSPQDLTPPPSKRRSAATSASGFEVIMITKALDNPERRIQTRRWTRNRARTHWTDARVEKEGKSNEPGVCLWYEYSWFGIMAFSIVKSNFVSAGLSVGMKMEGPCAVLMLFPIFKWGQRSIAVWKGRKTRTFVRWRPAIDLSTNWNVTHKKHCWDQDVCELSKIMQCVRVCVFFCRG